MNGKNINMFLIDGDVTSSIKCTLSNWTGVIYKIPREKLSSDAIREREHLKHSGIYFLLGQDCDEPVVYVGQVGNRKNGYGLLMRILEHTKNQDMDFFNEVIVLTTDNNVFGPTELNYLENQFTKKIRAAGRYNNKNHVEPNSGNVTEEKESELLGFLANSEMVIHLLGHRLFIPVPEQLLTHYVKHKELTPSEAYQDELSISDSGDLVVQLYIKRRMSNIRKTINATCIKDDRGYTVLPGSMINPISQTHDMHYLRDLRETLRQNDGIIDDILQIEQTFPTSSAAATFVLGTNASGTELWHTRDGRKLKEIQ